MDKERALGYDCDHLPNLEYAPLKAFFLTEIKLKFGDDEVMLNVLGCRLTY